MIGWLGKWTGATFLLIRIRSLIERYFTRGLWGVAWTNQFNNQKRRTSSYHEILQDDLINCMNESLVGDRNADRYNLQCSCAFLIHDCSLQDNWSLDWNYVMRYHACNHCTKSVRNIGTINESMIRYKQLAFRRDVFDQFVTCPFFRPNSKNLL